jgi:hypothetical protein
MAFDLSAVIHRAGKAAAENSPAILTAFAVAGTVATSYLIGRAGFKSGYEVRGIEEDHHERMSSRQIFDTTWRNYIPGAALAAMTVASIVSVKRIGDHRAAALAFGYRSAEKAFREYREKTLSKVGKNKEQAIRDEIVQDRAEADPVDNKHIHITHHGGGVLCQDQWTGRYFTSDMETIRSVVNDFNEQLLGDVFKSVNEFYRMMGLDAVEVGEMFGWTPDNKMRVTYIWSGDKQRGDECLHISFDECLPMDKYSYLH